MYWIFLGVTFFGGFYVGMVMMALISAAAEADEAMEGDG